MSEFYAAYAAAIIIKLAVKITGLIQLNLEGGGIRIMSVMYLSGVSKE